MCYTVTDGKFFRDIEKGVLLVEVVSVPIGKVKPYEKNPRKNDGAVEGVANSIKEFGWQQPIVCDKDMIIIAGHTRYKAALKLGLDSVPVVVADGLTAEQVKAYRLADNKTGELAEWDDILLAGELGGILNLDMSAFGFLDDIADSDGLGGIGERPEVEFTEELREEHNYVVLYFDNEVDWLQAQTLFKIEPKMSLSTRKDGTINKGNRKFGTGRVLNGAKALEVLLDENKR